MNPRNNLRGIDKENSDTEEKTNNKKKKGTIKEKRRNCGSYF